MKEISRLTAVILLAVGFVLANGSCSDDFDKYAESPEDRAEFSADTIKFDTLFSRVSSSTRTFMVYNRLNRSLRLSEVELVGGKNRGYRVNVDGHVGTKFSDLTILPKDSMFIFVEATFPEGESDDPVEVKDSLRFLINGRTDYVLLQGFRQNVDEVTALVIDRDTIFGAQRPTLLLDSLVVQQGATLTLPAGCRLLMANKAHIKVRGRLMAEGNPAKRVMIENLRHDLLVQDVPYTLVPGQWGGILFSEESRGNELRYTTIRNGRWGIIAEGGKDVTTPKLLLEGCMVTNTKGSGLAASGGYICILNSEISNTLGYTVALFGSVCELTQSTVCNFYRWDNRQGEALRYVTAFAPDVAGGSYTPSSDSRLILSNSIVDGSRSVVKQGDKESGGEISLSDGSPSDNEASVLACLTIRNSYVRARSSILNVGYNVMEADKNNPADSIYYSVGYDLIKKKYNFRYDYHPLPNAPFVGKADPAIIALFPNDLTGEPRRTATVGAFEVKPRP
ncbi:hypothetical protein [Porphyromonas gingivalis]|uniref:hypothetical protein n=1 Tax=Porphyromonas gingivalis TaxID=837 RepID=UPI000974FEE6|nr:hypothetical protein [Porphyromonas gingivalis]SJL23168.1 hypothetical protein PGIN_3A1_00113 [Porphyromonas gingivalis]